MNVGENTPLAGQVAIVAGATRGAGRGAAIELGMAGAKVYCTGRSTRERPSPINRPETIEETAEMVRSSGGEAVPIRVDFTRQSEVVSLFERVYSEEGRLDIFANSISGSYYNWNQPFWENEIDPFLASIANGFGAHFIAAHTAVNRMIPAGRGLIVSICDADYGNLCYGLEKEIINHFVRRGAREVAKRGIGLVALHPGYMRTEAILRGKGITEENWREGIAKDKHFETSETPRYTGRAIVALAADPNMIKKTGQTLRNSDLAREYEFLDVDGRQP